MATVTSAEMTHPSALSGVAKSEAAPSAIDPRAATINAIRSKNLPSSSEEGSVIAETDTECAIFRSSDDTVHIFSKKTIYSSYNKLLTVFFLFLGCLPLEVVIFYAIIGWISPLWILLPIGFLLVYSIAILLPLRQRLLKEKEEELDRMANQFTRLQFDSKCNLKLYVYGSIMDMKLYERRVSYQQEYGLIFPEPKNFESARFLRHSAPVSTV